MATKSVLLDSVAKVIKAQHTLRLEGIDAKKQKLLLDAYSDRYESTAEKISKGHILTSPPIDRYLNGILSEIIHANTGLRYQDYRILLARYPWPNASQLGEGTILLNIGLVTRLQNESQLAFVICHEIAHYVLDHVDKAVRKRIDVLESEDLKKQLQEIERTEYGTRAKVLALLKDISYDARRHSRSHEAQADSFALKLMMRTEYDAREAIGCLGILDHIDEEDTTGLDFARVFASNEYPFNKAWLTVQKNPFGDAKAKSEWEEDSLKTHPDCSRRIDLLVPYLEAYSHNVMSKASNSAFDHLQKTCMFEMALGYYHFEDIGHSLAEAIRSHQQYPRNSFFIGMIGLCLNKIYQAQKNHELGKYVAMPDEQLPPQYNLTLNFVQNLRLAEVAKIGYHFLKARGKDIEGEFQLFAWWGSCKIMGDTEGQAAAKALYLKSYPKGRFLPDIQSE